MRELTPPPANGPEAQPEPCYLPLPLPPRRAERDDAAEPDEAPRRVIIIDLD